MPSFDAIAQSPISALPTSIYNEAVTETSTASDSRVIAATGIVLVSETGTATTSQVAISTDNASLTETGVSSDSYSPKLTGVSSLSETSVSSDSVVIGESDSLSYTETSASSDLVNGVATVNGNATETAISADTFSGILSASGSLSETISANDNYTLSGTFLSDIKQTGPADGAEDIQRQKWLEHKKNKVLRAKKPKPVTIVPEIAAQKIELAKSVSKKLDNLKLPAPIENMGFHELLKSDLQTSKFIGALNSIEELKKHIEEERLKAESRQKQRVQEEEENKALARKVIEKQIIERKIAEKRAKEKWDAEAPQRKALKEKMDLEDDEILLMLAGVI